MPESHRMRLSDWGLLGLLSLLWGGSFFFAKVALAALPPLTVVLARVGIATAVLWLALRALRVPIPAGGAAWRSFFGMGLLNSLIPFSLIFWGQTFIDSGLAAILNATTPVFSILVAWLSTAEERLSPNRVAGIGLGVAGVAVMLGGQASAEGWGALPGFLACLGAALSYGFANTYGRRFRTMGIPPAVAAFGQMAGTTVMVLPLVLLVDRPWQVAAPGLAIWGALLGLALPSTALAYLIFFRLIASAGATHTSLVTLLIPVSAVLLGSALLGERLSLPQGCGMALIGAGLLAVDGRVFAWRGWGTGRSG